MSTNGVLLDEAWADRLAKIPWAWISVSPWDKKAQDRASALLWKRKINVSHPPGVEHSWAGQVIGQNKTMFKGCSFLNEGRFVIRWNGDLASCCISDREEDKIGHVDNMEGVTMRAYSICDTCHHAKG